MKAWASGGMVPQIINLASDPCLAMVEVNSQVHTPGDLRIERLYWVLISRLQPMLGYAAVNIEYHCHKK
jgi:hypothetical protein